MSTERSSRQGSVPLQADVHARAVAFIKCHGLGNDFVVVDGRAIPFEPSPARIRWICDRHLGIGGDQLLVFEAPRNPDATARLRIFNIDGLEAETCLNATRCAAWLLMEETKADAVVIETIGGLIPGRRAGDHRVSLTVGMGTCDWQSIPLAGPLEAANGLLDNGGLANPFAINMGNPHLVYFVPSRDGLDVQALAEPLQKSNYLPEQANIGVAEIVAEDRIRLVVYERPGILTAACGSGACAAVSVAWREKRITSRTVAVDMPGGLLEVTVLDDETLALTGSVSVSFHGFFPRE